MSKLKFPLQLWRFFTPSAIGFTSRNLVHTVLDKVQGNPPRTIMAADYVRQRARAGDPRHVLECLDRFALEKRWLMSVGPDKGPLIEEMAGKLPAAPRVLELGAYCGYSAIMMADRFGEDAEIVSIELNQRAVEASRSNIEVAGLSGQIEIIHGPSSKMIEMLTGSFDLVFLDHWKDLYKPDLMLLEKKGLVRAGTIVVADNVGEIFGETGYLDYVRDCGNYTSENRPATIEYTSVADAVEISVYHSD